MTTPNPYPEGTALFKTWQAGRRNIPVTYARVFGRGLIDKAWMRGHASRLADFQHQPGEILGGGLPDWPEDLTTYAERKAYQRGVADARHADSL